MSTFQPVRGMRDQIGQEAQTLSYVISKARETAQLFGFQEAITPIVEPLELLSAKSGDEIRQRMFIFDDLGGRRVALRPEFTASIARLATTALRSEPKPFRLFSVGSVYRYDEPQKGRYREFWQANFELMGSAKPEADAEIILLANSLLKNVGLTGYAIKLGHIGIVKAILSQECVDEKTQNAVFQKMDKKEYEAAYGLLSVKCKAALEGLVALKAETSAEMVENIKAYVQAYPQAVAAAENLAAIYKLVTEAGCPIQKVDPAFARGLEYYTGIIFELYVPELEIALGGGGRYDRLIEAFGGEPTPASGMALGVDRTAIAVQTQQITLKTQLNKRAVVMAIKEEQKVDAIKIAQALRDQGVSAEFEVMGRKMAKALEDADKRKVDYAVIVGERELKEGKVMLKDLANRTQTEIEIGALAEKLKS
jgi:histidyl-tRNA synthetase